jgi:hypothetical protein
MAIVIWSGPNPPDVRLLLVLAGGLVAGLFLLVGGFRGYRVAGRISGIASSPIGSIAAGEILVVGVAEPIELTLVSPLQSATCLYYRAKVTNAGDDGDRDLFREERAVGFRVRDDTGTIRVFPANARFEIPPSFNEDSSAWGGAPAGLLPRSGSAYGPGTDRESQIQALLTVHEPRRGDWSRTTSFDESPAVSSALAMTAGARRYEEARIDPGDVVTIVGRALPFGDLADPAAANVLDGSMVAADDPEVAADLAAARAQGRLEMSPADAWGNAAIEGFGIGRPVRAPELDPAATPPPPPDPALAARAAAAFEIPPESLVLASTPEAPLLVSLGAPSTIVARERARFVAGLLGAALAIGCAVALAWLWTNGMP